MSSLVETMTQASGEAEENDDTDLAQIDLDDYGYNYDHYLY